MIQELDKAAIGMRIRKRRELLGLSREELAKRLGVTAKFIGDLEYGEKGISTKNLYRLKHILGVSADYLLGGMPDDLTDEEEREMIQDNIRGSLSICSSQQLGVMEQMAQVYVEGIVRNRSEKE